ncbi:MAG: NfeD family protein [Clostridia bacterium]|nr:NfeD family protein [Clostridia bacterium]
MDAVLIIWLIGIILFVILEAVTYQLVSIWFAIGAAGGLVAAMCGADFNIQMTVFVTVSVIALLCLRPLSKKAIKTNEVKTNVDSLIGREVLITQEVNNIQASGKGIVAGMDWTVRSADDAVIAKDEVVLVEKVEGVKLIVKRKGE